MYVAELRKRRYRGKQPPAMTNPKDVAKLLARTLKDATREHFLVLLLNSRHTVLAVETVSVGSLNASIVHPREVFRQAILSLASAVILAHNHPSGDPEPSPDDMEITKRLSQAGELLGIEVLDHVILGGNGQFQSFREKGLLRATEK
ncbi:MAG: DNA repair protein RadC [Armatimonadetes bacterium]|nr:DNA repair protein RadC [Armatimonadota bacterium]